jgi:hypothetical protein
MDISVVKSSGHKRRSTSHDPGRASRFSRWRIIHGLVGPDRRLVPMKSFAKAGALIDDLGLD